MTARCSLKEVALCVKLLKPRHLDLLKAGDLLHLKDFKIKSNINRRLAAFLMYRIDPVTMILDLGDGSKVLQITADVIEKLFKLPRGNSSPKRPRDDAVALRKLKDELGIPRNIEITTKNLRNILKKLVEDPKQDSLAMKVFGLIVINKFICPGYGLRVKKEAAMVEGFSFAKLKETDVCQLVVEELKKAVAAWQVAGAEWRALPGCFIAVLLAYLECIDDPKLNPIDKRVPRVLYYNPKKLMELGRNDLIRKGTKDPRTWIFGKSPVSRFVLIIHMFPVLTDLMGMYFFFIRCISYACMILYWYCSATFILVLVLLAINV